MESHQELSEVALSSLHPVKSSSALSDMSADVTVSTDCESSVSSIGSSRRVAFGEIQVRDYERIVGDHPDTKVGVPLSLGWAYSQRDAVAIDRYEADRISKGNLRMSSITRKNILHNVFGVPEKELRAAEKEVQKIRKSRVKSVRQSDAAAKSESAVRNVGRKFRKVLRADAFIKGLAAAASGGMMLSVSH